ncbi:hypothetical protein CCACVL1_26035 [Corchorus capsularis]|uniref:Uncharacterized protein n=1 Tax=Corchorus capsularis TaxID=210143 RepID=A0A1R3GG42_COCAP|nr:hypothetical protein CCACVL1_26035 [Corchorus capsularis]
MGQDQAFEAQQAPESDSSRARPTPTLTRECREN